MMVEIPVNVLINMSEAEARFLVALLADFPENEQAKALKFRTMLRLKNAITDAENLAIKNFGGTVKFVK
jgi:hypothetical protein